MDDLLKDLDSERKETKPVAKVIKYSKESEAFYRQNSKSNRQLRNKNSLKREILDSEVFVEDAWEGLGKFLSVMQMKYCKAALKTQDGIRKNYENRRGVCRPLEIFVDLNIKTARKEMRCWLVDIPSGSDGRLVAIAKYNCSEGKFGGF